MTEILPFTFPTTGQPVRSVVIDGEPWFVGADVTTILGYANGSRDINRHVPERHRRLYRIGTPSGEQSVSVINEPGAYRLIMRSNQEQAEAFQDWLAEDVIPSIRRTGSYSMPTPVTIEVSVNALAELAHNQHVVPAAARILAFARWRKPRKGMEAFVQLALDIRLPGVEGSPVNVKALPAKGERDA